MGAGKRQGKQVKRHDAAVRLRNECLMLTKEARAFMRAAWVWEGAQTSRQEGVREDTWQLMKAMERSEGG